MNIFGTIKTWFFTSFWVSLAQAEVAQAVLGERPAEGPADELADGPAEGLADGPANGPVVFV